MLFRRRREHAAGGASGELLEVARQLSTVDIAHLSSRIYGSLCAFHMNAPPPPLPGYAQPIDGARPTRAASCSARRERPCDGRRRT